MFSFSGNPADASGYFTPYTVVLLVCGILFSAPILPYLREKLTQSGHETLCNAVSSVVCIPLYLLCVMTLASSAFNPFIYYIF